MGYNTQFQGELLFTDELRASQIAKLETILGEDCRDHPEWGRTDLTYIDLEFNKDYSGLVWSGAEKTYDLVDKVNLIVDLMKKETLFFGLKGQLLAQGEEVGDLWYLRMNEKTGYAERVDYIPEPPEFSDDALEEASRELMTYVIEKYGVRNYDEFTCPHHRKLAQVLELFPTHKK